MNKSSVTIPRRGRIRSCLSRNPPGAVTAGRALCLVLLAGGAPSFAGRRCPIFRLRIFRIHSISIFSMSPDYWQRCLWSSLAPQGMGGPPSWSFAPPRGIRTDLKNPGARHRGIRFSGGASEAYPPPSRRQRNFVFSCVCCLFGVCFNHEGGWAESRADQRAQRPLISGSADSRVRQIRYQQPARLRALLLLLYANKVVQPKGYVKNFFSVSICYHVTYISTARQPEWCSNSETYKFLLMFC